MRTTKERFTVWRCQRCDERYTMPYQMGVEKRTHTCENEIARLNDPRAPKFERGIATIYYHYDV